ncbi:tetraspanin [Plakobranchus ocellatus]|uniref:Tetraspanin n=1 Tax=Plakobranchus ocellatus TaxID=259542 RepID=A0AAV3ZH57_9GAST|nr:tetraspanin [Plakobranchus ocellatus]
MITWPDLHLLNGKRFILSGEPHDTLLGCAILGVGIWLRLDENAADFLKDSSKIDVIYAVAYVMIAIGFIIMLLGFLGCCGAIRESQWMLGAFFVMLFIIFATLLGFGIWAAAAKDSFKETTEEMLEDGVNNYYKDEKQRAFIDSIQSYFNCCGHKNGNTDYLVVGDIPDSCNRDDYHKFHCCGWDKGADDFEKGLDKGAPPSCDSDNYEKPCNDQFYKWLENRLVVIAAVAIGVAVVLIMGMAFSLILCCAIRDTLA